VGGKARCPSGSNHDQMNGVSYSTSSVAVDFIIFFGQISVVVDCPNVRSFVNATLLYPHILSQTFLRTCLGMYFIKRKAEYNRAAAKEELSRANRTTKS
jgi:hypothetical protein